MHLKMLMKTLEKQCKFSTEQKPTTLPQETIWNW